MGMNLLKVDPQRIHFHEGWFADTFPEASIGLISFLHVDGDFSASVKLALQPGR